jgi:hypothetical protein
MGIGWQREKVRLCVGGTTHEIARGCDPVILAISPKVGRCAPGGESGGIGNSTDIGPVTRFLIHDPGIPCLGKFPCLSGKQPGPFPMKT